MSDSDVDNRGSVSDVGKTILIRADVTKLFWFADVGKTIFIRGCTEQNYAHLN